MARVDFDIHGSVAVIAFDHPPLNILGFALRRDLAAALSRAGGDPDVKAIVLTGQGGLFSAGVDVRELGTPDAQRAPTLRHLVTALEASDKPIVAAITGPCLGGGLELALACHHRVAVLGAPLGLPEIQLGLIPGAGGTQRLPRLVGIEKALNMILSGEPVAASRLADTALLDRTTSDDAVTSAIDLAATLAARGFTPRRTRELRVVEPNIEPLCQFAHNTVAQLYPRLLAPARCIDAIRVSSRPFDEGSEIERSLFRQLLDSPQSHALRYAYFADRAAWRIPDVPNDVPTRHLNSAGVVGAGPRGTSITMSLIENNIPVTLLEASKHALENGIDAIRRSYSSAVKSGQISIQGVERRIGLIMPALDERKLAEADIILDTVTQPTEAQASLFRKLDVVMKPGALLAPTACDADLDKLAQQTQRPQDVIGVHFVHTNFSSRLLEVARGSATSQEALATVIELAKRLQKLVVVTGVCDGFIGKRMQREYVREAMKLVEEGVSPEHIDSAIEAFGIAAGPFRNGPPEPRRPTRDIDDQEIVDRLILALVNEGARLLKERIASRASDIDVVFRHGYGFPSWRGGPMFYADELGADEVLRRMKHFGWTPAPLVTRLAASGDRFQSEGTGPP
jgi:3-hydroxyacyl-CoA dehydrogenase